MKDAMVEGGFGGRPSGERSGRGDRLRAHGIGQSARMTPKPVERLARLADLASVASEIDLLILTLRDVRADQDRALGYLSKPGSNVVLGRALLSRAITKRSQVLRRLDLDRQWADRLLGEIDAAEGVPIGT